MKNIVKTLFVVGLCTLSSCADLDLNPLSNGSSENWYKDETEIEMSLNDFLRPDFFPIDGLNWDDDILDRNGSNAFTLGTITSQTSTTNNRWKTLYKAVSRAIKILESLDKVNGNINEQQLNQYKGEAYFMLGFAYGELASYYGDCVLIKDVISLDDAYTAFRSPKEEVLKFSYECLDKAANLLPVSHTGQQRPTSGAALGIKARFALFNYDYEIAADASKKCMDLNVYELHNSFANLFVADVSPELIFYFKGDLTLKYGISLFGYVRNFVVRKLGGYANESPSLELLCSYNCVDGLPIDKSPLYNPKDPFENRDPRLAMTIQPFKTKYSKDYAAYEQSKIDGTFPTKYPDYILFGYEYNPNPYAVKEYEVATGKLVTNAESKATSQHSAYNGLMMKKFVKDNWKDYSANGNNSDNNYPYLRYAEVLLTYAEAMNELGKCTQEVLDNTVNKVRERAYNDTGITYPKVMAASQNEIRKIIKIERRSEFAFEGIRYRDLLRWRIAEKSHNKPMYYLSRSWSGSAKWNGKTGSSSNVKLSSDFMKILDNWDNGNFPVGGTPKIDENGLPDLSSMKDNGYITVFYKMNFDKDKNYLWPIPADDNLLNQNLGQNDNY